MKILHIISSLKIGGAEAAFISLMKHWAANPEHEHVVAFFYSGPHEATLKQLGVRCYQITGFIRGYDPLGFIHLLRMANCEKPAIIHTALWSANLMGRLVGRLLKIPVMSELHGNPAHEGPLRNWCERKTAHLSSAIIAVSNSVGRQYERAIVPGIAAEQRGLVSSRLVVIRNGIEMGKKESPFETQSSGQAASNCSSGSSIFLNIKKDTAQSGPTQASLQSLKMLPECETSSPPSSSSLRARASERLERAQSSGGVTPADFVIGSIGRFEPIKSYDVLIRAFALARKESAGFTLLLIGDGSERAKLEKLVVELGIADHVSMPGYRTDTEKFYPLMDCFALSSQSEGLSLALLQALAHGVPVVTTHTENEHDAIEPGINGFLVPPNNPEALAEKLLAVYKLKRAGQLSNIRLDASFDLARVCVAYEKLYKQLAT